MNIKGYTPLDVFDHFLNFFVYLPLCMTKLSNCSVITILKLRIVTLDIQII